MSNKKVIALSTADLHTHKFRNFNVNNSRLKNTVDAIKHIDSEAAKLGVPVLFSGDLIHDPKFLENETGKLLHKTFAALESHWLGISGNHDFSEKNGLDHCSPSHLDSFIHHPKFTHVIQSNTPWSDSKGNFLLWGLPYMNNDKDLAKAINTLRVSAKTYAKRDKGSIHVLLLHTDLPGAKTPEGTIINETDHIPLNMDKFFEPWDLVLCGHIHRPQKLSNKCYMLGSPIHQNAGDKGIKMGYWEVYSDASMKFIHLDKYPKFRQLKQGEKPTNETDYWIEYDEVLVDENVEVGEFNIANSRKELASRYMKTKGIKDKLKRRELIKILNEAE